MLKDLYLKSDDFEELAESTKSEYRRHISHVEPLLHTFPIRLIRRSHAAMIREKFKDRPTLAEASQRACEEHELKTFREANPLGTRARLAFERGLGTALGREDLCKVAADALLAETFGVRTGKSGDLLVLGVTAGMREAYIAFAEAR